MNTFEATFRNGSLSSRVRQRVFLIPMCILAAIVVAPIQASAQTYIGNPALNPNSLNGLTGDVIVGKSDSTTKAPGVIAILTNTPTHTPTRLFTYSDSQTTLSGGELWGDMQVHDSSLVTISGLTYHRGNIGTFENSTINMTGGEVASSQGYGVQIRDSSTFNMSGGTVEGNLGAYEGGKINIRDGSVILGFLGGLGNSTINLNGGSVGRVLQAYGGKTYVTGDAAINQGVESYASALVTISGGTVASKQLANLGGDFNLIGTGLTASLSDFSNYHGQNGWWWNLGGTLANGTSLNGTGAGKNYTGYRYFELGGSLGQSPTNPRKIEFTPATAAAPEPGSLALFGLVLPLIGLSARRRRF